MSDTITLTGVVATTPRHVKTATGLFITSFRLASTQRRFDRNTQKWMDGDTNWYTITAFRQLATNTYSSVSLGERVVVTGKLKIREWKSGDRAGTNIDVEAEALGHDLTWGTAMFNRVRSSPAGEQPTEDPGAYTVGGAESAEGTLTPLGGPPSGTVDAEGWAVAVPGYPDNHPAGVPDSTASLPGEFDAAADGASGVEGGVPVAPHGNSTGADLAEEVATPF